MRKVIVITILVFLIWQIPLFAQNIIHETRSSSSGFRNFKKDKNISPSNFSQEKLFAANQDVAWHLIVSEGLLAVSPEKESQTGKRALIGFAAGAAPGAVICGLKYRHRPLFLVTSAFGCGLLGGLIGAILGRVTSKSDEDEMLYQQF